jgi:hypothetical protein
MSGPMHVTIRLSEPGNLRSEPLKALAKRKPEESGLIRFPAEVFVCEEDPHRAEIAIRATDEDGDDESLLWIDVELHELELAVAVMRRMVDRFAAPEKPTS